jgi:hypothetical protein
VEDIMTRLAMLLALGGVLGAGAALAEEGCAFDYATFESTVPHFDLDACPDAVEDAEGAFCRASIHMEILTVWVFDEDGDRCFRRVQQFFEEDYDLTVR